MDMRVAGALIGFTLGFIGYIIFKIWISPIRRYRRLKAGLEADIKSYVTLISKQTWGKTSKKQLKDTRKKISDLTDCYEYDIPAGYRIILKSRKESPLEAAKHLMDLANIKEGTHALKRLEKAEAALLIKRPEGT